MAKSKEKRTLRNAFVAWLGLPLSDYKQLMPPDNSAGQSVSESTVLSLSAAFACARLISEAVGSLPFKVYRRLDDGGRILAGGHPIAHIIGKSPNADTTPAQFWSAICASMLFWGNGFAEIKRIGSRIVALEFIHPSRIRAEYDQSGKIAHWVHTDRQGRQRIMQRKDVLHIAAFGVDGQLGVSAITAGAAVFGSGLAANAQANNTFKNGLAQTFGIKLSNWLRDDQREAMRERIQEISGSINAGKPALLEGGMEPTIVGVNPKDAQLLESRSFSVEEVCRWFGVDPSLIGHGTAVSNWGTGLEQKMIGFLTFTIMPILNRIEQAVDKIAFLDDVHYSEHIVEGLLRADSAGRAALYQAYVNSGIVDRDEVREKENLPRRGGNSAKQTIQHGFTTLDNIGKQDE